MLSVLIWWLILEVIALVVLPIALQLFRHLPDRGVGLARPLGLLLSGYLFWLLVTLGILENTVANIVFVLLALAAVSAYLWARQRAAFAEALRARWRVILATELLFLLALAAFALFRAYNPDISATEKPMEFGFINAILRSRTFPPRDPWLAGYAISYYYFGYVISAMLTRLSGLGSNITFNLTGCTLFALTMTGAFTLVYNLVQAYLDRRAQLKGVAQAVVARASLLTGFLGTVLVALMGNLEGVFELLRAHGLVSEALLQWLDVKDLHVTPLSASWYPDDGWWWWRASRVVHDVNALGQSSEVIDEFPFFSFLLGDNHPHVLALPFVFLALGLALNLLLSWSEPVTQAAANEGKEGVASRVWRWLGDIWAGGPLELFLWALLVGSLGFLNTWDYPIYLAIMVLAYAIRRQTVYGKVGWNWLYEVVRFGALLLVVGLALYAPFYIGFRSQAGGIAPVGEVKTRLHQYLLMFGVALFFVLSFLVAQGGRYLRLDRSERKLPKLAQFAGAVFGLVALFSLVQGWWTAGTVLAGVAVASVLLIWASVLKGEGGKPRLEESSLFVLLLIIVGLGLTASVDLVFLKDTFGTRMNTVFKFYYQGWVLLGVAGAYGAFYVVDRWRAQKGAARGGLVLWSLVGIALVGTGLSYTVAAITSKANGFRGAPTLDGTRYVAQYRRDDYDAIQWLRDHATPGAVMLEATGPQYSEYDWVSASTGIPTLLGWGGHELQWRGNYDEPGRREQDIDAIYKSLDANAALALLDKYRVDYIYLGNLERDHYHLSQPMIRKFDRILVRAYENPSVIIYARAR